MTAIKNGMGSHHSAKMMKDEWLTPPEIIEALGDFDLDPCAPVIRPWNTAKKHYTINDDGLNKTWRGRVWCNPPYGPMTAKWLNKLSLHGNGIALIFARTETKTFFKYVWNRASGLLFIEGRLYFYHMNGLKAISNAGAPSVLIAYGDNNAEILKNTSIEGKYIHLDNNHD